MPRSPSPSHQPGHRIGTVAGIPVHASWTLGLVAALISFSVATSLLPSTVSGLGSGVRTVLGLTAAALFIGSILVHELAHALVARRGGLPVDGITLWLFGGAAFLPEQPRRPGHALAIALAGPLASLALGAGAFGLVVAGRSLDAPSSLLVTLGWVGLMNVALAVFNMLPGLPLDGGRVLQALLWLRSGNPDRATVTAARAGRVVGFGLVGLGVAGFVTGGGLSLWTAAIGWIIASAARAEGSAAERRQAVAGVRVGEAMVALPAPVPDYLTVAELARSVPWPAPAYPVQAFSGRVVGVVPAERVRQMAAVEADRLRVSDLVVPSERLVWAQPGELISDVLERSADPLGGVIVVGSPDTEWERPGTVGPDGLAPLTGLVRGAVGIVKLADVRSLASTGVG